MDTSRKNIRDKCSCNYCMNYRPIYKSGKKTCYGKCIYTGIQKKRTDKCKRYFEKGNMISFLRGDPND